MRPRSAVLGGAECLVAAPPRVASLFGSRKSLSYFTAEEIKRNVKWRKLANSR